MGKFKKLLIFNVITIVICVALIIAQAVIGEVKKKEVIANLSGTDKMAYNIGFYTYIEDEQTSNIRIALTETMIGILLTNGIVNFIFFRCDRCGRRLVLYKGYCPYCGKKTE